MILAKIPQKAVFFNLKSPPRGGHAIYWTDINIDKIINPQAIRITDAKNHKGTLLTSLLIFPPYLFSSTSN